jgi:hypothetical protein
VKRNLAVIPSSRVRDRVRYRASTIGRVLLAAAAMIACGPAQTRDAAPKTATTPAMASTSTPPATQPPSTPATSPAPPAPTPAPAPPDAPAKQPPSEGDPIPAPGCTAAEGEARRRELDTLGEKLRAPGADPKAGLDALRAMLSRPCLAHLKPTIRLPPRTSIEKLRDAWSSLDTTLAEATRGLHVKYGKRLLVIPREILPDLSADVQRRLAPMLCPPNDATCDRTASYILRAHEAFDTDLRIREQNLHPKIDYGTLHVEIPVQSCDGSQRPEDAPTTFESWASCVTSRAPRNWRYAETRFRAPERGWLVLRGRRGHYEFADELRAYDLATGAAYVVRDTGAFIVTDRARQFVNEAYTGRIAPDQLRELAFLLLTRPAIVELRTGDAYAVIPDKLPLVLATNPDQIVGWGRSSWASSNQTTLSFTFVDGAQREAGTFIWPDADDWVNNHIVQLLRVAEAGLVRGCAPAKLPPLADLRGDLGKVSPIDASADALRARHAELERRLDGLRPSACAGAK